MRARLLLTACCGVFAFAGHAFGQGFVLPGVGPINRSMGGAATAAPLDATGAINWNPATLSGLPQSRVDIGVDVIFNRNTVNSAFLRDTPGELIGSTDSAAGVWALPAIGIAYKPQESPWAYGLGISAIGGFSVNYPGSATNPIFTPPPPNGVGFGPAYTRLGILQLAPTVAYQLTDRLSVGFAPTISIADAQASPFPFASPDDANGDTFFTYPPATGSKNVWGLGAQGGLFYEGPAGVNLGVSVRSPVWFQRFQMNSRNELGVGQEVTTQLNYPMIVSMGAAYTGIKDVLLALDVRYVDFASTQAFGEPAITTPTGALRGLGWESVWLVAGGVQLKLTDTISVRAGYSYNQNPIQERLVFYNVFAPAIYQHVFNLGASIQLSESIVASLTWVHGFDNTIDGPYLSPMGAVPFSRVSLNQEIDTAVFGLSILF
jgi:long-chain fatty acid transport protein